MEWSLEGGYSSLHPAALSIWSPSPVQQLHAQHAPQKCLSGNKCPEGSLSSSSADGPCTGHGALYRRQWSLPHLLSHVAKHMPALQWKGQTQLACLSTLLLLHSPPHAQQHWLIAPPWLGGEQPPWPKRRLHTDHGQSGRTPKCPESLSMSDATPFSVLDHLGHYDSGSDVSGPLFILGNYWGKTFIHADDICQYFLC